MAKAWQHIGAIGRRTFWDPQTVLVVGAGPIGLLAALIGVQQGADTHVLDRATSGPKPALVKQRGASHHTGPIADLVHPDIVVECTGVIQLARQAMDTVSPGIICLTGVGSPAVPDTVLGDHPGHRRGAQEHRLFGSVNANRRHCYRAAKVPMGLVRFPDGKVQHDRGPCRRAPGHPRVGDDAASVGSHAGGRLNHQITRGNPGATTDI